MRSSEDPPWATPPRGPGGADEPVVARPTCRCCAGCDWAPRLSHVRAYRTCNCRGRDRASAKEPGGLPEPVAVEAVEPDPGGALDVERHAVHRYVGCLRGAGPTHQRPRSRRRRGPCRALVRSPRRSCPTRHLQPVLRDLIPTIWRKARSECASALIFSTVAPSPLRQVARRCSVGSWCELEAHFDQYHQGDRSTGSGRRLSETPSSLGPS